MKAHEKGNGSAPKSTSSKTGATVKNAADKAPIKSEQVWFLLDMYSILYLCKTM